MNDLRIFVDTEYAYDEMTPGYGRPKGHEKIQIIQIAAILFDMSNGKELDSFDIIVQPPYLKNIPTFFTELTNISEADINKNGILFPEAYKLFTNFIKDYPIWTFEKDEFVFRKNCSYYGLHFPFFFTKVKPLLKKYSIDASQYSSGTLFKSVDIKMPDNAHNALHDVRSMAQTLYVLENK